MYVRVNNYYNCVYFSMHMLAMAKPLGFGLAKQPEPGIEMLNQNGELMGWIVTNVIWLRPVARKK